MYVKDDEKYFIVDSHVHLWDGRAENQKNIHGKQFIDCFFDYHSNLSPDAEKWDYETYCYYGPDRLMKDLFEDGYVDYAIFQTTMLQDFFHKMFSRADIAWPLVQENSDKMRLNYSFDPRFGEEGLDWLRADAEKYDLKGVKLYTAEWNGQSRGYKLSDPWARRYLETCLELGIKNIHVHKGPTLKPLDRDAFDVADVDAVASDYLDLNFIVEHCGLPRLEDFCWIATQESNVYGGLSVVMPCSHTRPRDFGQVLGELLYWIGEDKITFSSDYALWTPKWLIERFVDFQIPEDMQSELGTISTTARHKILGLNAAKLYDIPVPDWSTAPKEAEESGIESEVAVGASA